MVEKIGGMIAGLGLVHFLKALLSILGRPTKYVGNAVLVCAAV